MYITPEVHDAICEAGLWGIGITFGTMALAVGIPWIWRKTRFIRMRMRENARFRREIRRYKAAMKVFDKPVRWSEK